MHAAGALLARAALRWVAEHQVGILQCPVDDTCAKFGRVSGGKGAWLPLRVQRSPTG